MFDLTPTERRGALVLLALVAIGTCADLLQLEPAPTPEPPPVAATATAPAPGAAPPGALQAGPLDLNTASEADLDRLPGIGPVLAGRIVAHRAAHGPFHQPDDLLAVPGIGPRVLERLRPLVTAGAARAPSGAGVQNARRPAK